MVGCGVIEAHGPTDEARRRAAPAMAEDRVAIAHLLVPELVEPGSRCARFARKPVPFSVRHESEVARLEPPMVGALHFEPTPTGCHHMKAQASGSCRQRQGPGSAELGPAVERAGHPQKMKGLAERVDGPPRILHGDDDAL